MAAKDEIAEAPACSGGVTSAALAPAGAPGCPARRCPVCRLYAAAVAQVNGCEPGPAEPRACGLIMPPCASRSIVRQASICIVRRRVQNLSHALAQYARPAIGWVADTEVVTSVKMPSQETGQLRLHLIQHGCRVAAGRQSALFQRRVAVEAGGGCAARRTCLRGGGHCVRMVRARGRGRPEEALAVLLHLQLECKDMGPNGVSQKPMQQSKLQSRQDGAEHLECVRETGGRQC